jgi:hypothetical protein
MRDDKDSPKVVYLNKFKRRGRKINWPWMPGQHPGSSKDPWVPSKQDNLPENEGKVER